MESGAWVWVLLGGPWDSITLLCIVLTQMWPVKTAQALSSSLVPDLYHNSSGPWPFDLVPTPEPSHWLQLLSHILWPQLSFHTFWFKICSLSSGFYYSGESFFHLSTLCTLVWEQVKLHVSHWGALLGIFHPQTIGARGCLERTAGPAGLDTPVTHGRVRTAVWALWGRPKQWHIWVKTIYWRITRWDTLAENRITILHSWAFPRHPQTNCLLLWVHSCSCMSY